LENRFDGVERQILIAGQGHFAIRRQDVDEVMRNSLPLVLVRFGDTDVKPPIEVPRISVDDFSAKFSSQGNAKSRLADGGGTGYHDNARARFLLSP
jgi:hypothetical protein